MSETASDFLIKRINEWGWKRIVGHSGDGIDGTIGALENDSSVLRSLFRTL